MFVGSDVMPNVQGMQWFLESVWPLVLAKNPQATLEIIGKVCRELKGVHRNVSMRDIVNDLSESYAQAEVCLVPLQFGSGLKIKLVEAMSYGRVCVCTSTGNQGMEAQAGIVTLVADDAVAFAGHVLELMHNANLRQRMEENAREFVCAHLSEEAAYGPFFKRIRDFAKTP